MKITIKELATFALLGAFMFASKQVMEFLPNIHLLGVLTVAYTVVYRTKALFPIYVNVGLQGLYAGFNTWWLPYLYIWTVLWAVTMLLPHRMPKPVAVPVYALVCGLHGLAYGTLYAPVQALVYGYDLKRTLTWIAIGFPWDVTHAIGNVCLGALLIVPLITLLRQVQRLGERI